MNYAFIKDNICVNVAVFETDEDANNFKQFVPVDDIIKIPDGFGIVDKYEDGSWIKQELTIVTSKPTIEERLTQLEVLTVNNISNQIENQILKGEL